MEHKKSKVLSVLLLVGIVGLIVILCLDLFPILKEVYQDRNDESKMIRYIAEHGAKGAPILIGLQALQVIVAVFPAAAIQVLAGLCYGVWLGALLSLVGYVAGNILVFAALRQFKATLVPYLPKPKKDRSHFIEPKRIKAMKNPEYAAFLLYLLPGIPNGVLPYLFADTKITFPRYLFSVTAASIPSVFLCTWLGDCLAEKNFLMAGILIAVAVIALVLLLVFKNKLTALFDQWTGEHKKKQEETPPAAKTEG